MRPHVYPVHTWGKDGGMGENFPSNFSSFSQILKFSLPLLPPPVCLG